MKFYDPEEPEDISRSLKIVIEHRLVIGVGERWVASFDGGAHVTQTTFLGLLDEIAGVQREAWRNVAAKRNERAEAIRSGHLRAAETAALRPRVFDLDTDIRDVPCGVRLKHCLINGGFRSLRDTEGTPDAELLKTENFGKVSLRELRRLITEARERGQ